MFRNLRLYRLDDWPDAETAVSDALATAGFEPCGPLTERSSGFVPVYPEASDAFARRLGGADLMRLRSQSRVLPAAAVNEALESRLAEYRERRGDEPGPREKRRLKAETRDALLQQALLKSDHIAGFVDLKENVLAIDSAGEPNAERFIRRLRAALGDVGLRPLGFDRPVDELLAKVFLGGAPRQFALGRECRMQDAKDPAATVRWNEFDLSDRSIRRHVTDGMRLTQVAIEYDHVMSFVLDGKGVMTKVRLLGSESSDDDDPLARFDAEFALLSGTFRNLLADMKRLLGGYG
ncbi:MAG: recombination-associated protein RdgC [Woeseiaceae bacterium]|nr:recombination-associated protein RdgC [Woeseiaceae bacterium]